MGATFNIKSFVRGVARRVLSGATEAQNCDMNAGADLILSQGLPERTEITRLGYSFSCQHPVGSAFNLLASIPTTMSELSLQNGETVGGSTSKCYVIERFWIKNTITTTSLGVLTPLSQVVPPGTALVADDATVLRMSLSGKLSPATRTNAKIVMHSILTGCLQDKWNHHTALELRATTNIGHVVEVPCFGKYIIPPGGSFNVNVESSVAVASPCGICGIEWHEVFLDLGS